jgi:sulfite reductase beta subunit-like hemoprotein
VDERLSIERLARLFEIAVAGHKARQHGRHEISDLGFVAISLLIEGGVDALSINSLTTLGIKVTDKLAVTEKPDTISNLTCAVCASPWLASILRPCKCPAL